MTAAIVRSDGARNTTLHLADGTPVPKVRNITWAHHFGDAPRITAEILLVRIEAEGRLSFTALDPVTGRALEGVKGVVFDDGMVHHFIEDAP